MVWIWRRWRFESRCAKPRVMSERAAGQTDYCGARGVASGDRRIETLGGVSPMDFESCDAPGLSTFAGDDSTAWTATRLGSITSFVAREDHFPV